MTLNAWPLVALFLLSISAWAAPVAPVTFSVMSYNVENLFDTVHDAGKQDWTYLALDFKRQSREAQAYCKSQQGGNRDECLNLDWSPATLAKKMDNLAQVIKSYDGGKGPDIVVMPEVENINVLTQFRDTALRSLGYKYVILIEGPDVRGIDVGMLSRFPVNRQQLNAVNLNDGDSKKLTRGILEVEFSINGACVVVLGNHWPSQGSDSETRYTAAERLMDVAKKQTCATIAVGDFNTLDSDSPNGIREVLLDPSQSPRFQDAVAMSGAAWEGSLWFKGSWSMFDHVFVLDKGRQSGSFSVDWKSFMILSPDFASQSVTYNGQTFPKVPLRFEPKTGKGYSDHYPVAMKFKI